MISFQIDYQPKQTERGAWAVPGLFGDPDWRSRDAAWTIEGALGYVSRAREGAQRRKSGEVFEVALTQAAVAELRRCLGPRSDLSREPSEAALALVAWRLKARPSGYLCHAGSRIGAVLPSPQVLNPSEASRAFAERPARETTLGPVTVTVLSPDGGVSAHDLFVKLVAEPTRGLG